jgi:RNA 3'-terminal phosphate cyclase (ATP)
MNLIEIDGRHAEGGGQILRSAVGLAAALGVPVRVHHIRAGRAKPGLLRQHFAAVHAVAQVCQGQLVGAELGSTEVSFWPGTIRPGDYEFSVGSAGSALLVLQTLLPALLVAGQPSRLRLRGGTHNPGAPSSEFAALTLAPALAKLGARLEIDLLRPGFFPAGGGELLATLHPAENPQPLHWLERGAVQSISAICHLADLPAHVGERETKWLRRALNLSEDAVQVRDWPECGPGNALAAIVQTEHGAEVVTGFGQRGVSASQVADQVAREVKAWLAADVPVGGHLADQLIAPLAVLRGGSFRTVAPTPHLLSQIEVVRALLGERVALHGEGPGLFRVEVTGNSA